MEGECGFALGLPAGSTDCAAGDSGDAPAALPGACAARRFLFRRRGEDDGDDPSSACACFCAWERVWAGRGRAERVLAALMERAEKEVVRSSLEAGERGRLMSTNSSSEKTVGERGSARWERKSAEERSEKERRISSSDEPPSSETVP